MALHRGCTQFSPPSVHKDACFPHFQQQGMLLNFLFFARLIGRKHYLIVTLIFISFIIKDSEYLFISSRTTWISFSVKEPPMHILHPFFCYVVELFIFYGNKLFNCDIKYTFSLLLVLFAGYIYEEFLWFYIPNFVVLVLWFLTLWINASVFSSCIFMALCLYLNIQFFLWGRKQLYFCQMVFQWFQHHLSNNPFLPCWFEMLTLSYFVFGSLSTFSILFHWSM